MQPIKAHKQIIISESESDDDFQQAVQPKLFVFTLPELCSDIISIPNFYTAVIYTMPIPDLMLVQLHNYSMLPETEQKS